ncbi:MAG TPA: hypothetical protein VJ770_19235 [Stellaceae bacterium]|nr:hypothetical protein [Stellaceae bacterium]
MSEPLFAIRQLRTVAARLSELPDQGGEDGTWFVARLAEYESGARHGMRFDELLGLIPGAGGETWWAAENRERRNALLQEIATRFFPGKALSCQAKEIAKERNEYERSAWRRHRTFRDPPASVRGTVRELLFWMLKCGGPSLSEERIRRILKAGHQTPSIAAQ